MERTQQKKAGIMETLANAKRTLLSALVASCLAVGLVVIASPSYAAHADRVGKARHTVLGKSIHNKRTHLTVTTIGTWKFYRRVHGHKVPFWSFRVSAQRQHNHGGTFYGPVREGRIRPPHQLGKPVGHNKRAGNAAIDFCMLNTPLCADPWNWVAKNVPRPYTEVNQHITKPCIAGVIGGYGGVGSSNVIAWMLYKAGAIAKAAAKKAILGPEGAGVAALGGCFIGVSKHGITNWQKLYNRLFFPK
jgi:hypothetical protein